MKTEIFLYKKEIIQTLIDKKTEIYTIFQLKNGFLKGKYPFVLSLLEFYEFNLKAQIIYLCFLFSVHKCAIILPVCR